MIEHPVKVAELSELEPGAAVVIPPEVSGHSGPIALFNTDGGFRAVEDLCTHLGASLAKSRVEGNEVDCWLHHGRFCLDTGKATKYPAREQLATFPVEVRGTAVWLLP
ncbi:Benzene 1,2-dioxygenase system ferredoxin subunit [Corynebacterium occultum]|uniref:Benzene 1,2-dioxygenase system ferredoxin subunit n=1 Tax=Corynebacterium occultum TaxID=2675219 RepID=A0A6B8W527_9CORY|nr:non-heme iron oxygenase ferredoxin subunit [Corynebacterium occultum]QGU08664.1 Benzene 1,2-dioxygenase system ferredoxin subunit [Corynebacterium occultum]